MKHAAEIRFTRVAAALTLIAAALALAEVARIGVDLARLGDWPAVASQAIFALALIVMVGGGLAYHLARIGYLVRTPDDETDEAQMLDDAPAVCILVPAYKESPDVVRRTLISAALQRYPARRIVLLIDDPRNPRNAEDAASLDAMRKLPQSLARTFAVQSARLDVARKAFVRRVADGSYDALTEPAALAALWNGAADWVEDEIARHDRSDHSAALLIERVLVPCRDAHRQQAQSFLQMAESAQALDADTALREYRRLAAVFRVGFSSFERKRYENLSHEANKAMNLNSYLSLMGGSYREVRIANGTGLCLERSPQAPGTIDIPDAPFVLTLDADSILLPDYTSRLAAILMRPGNERVAVAQTPYSAFPGAPGLLERIAGAQTDIQYLMHQGFTRNNATFWVGANALLRKAALEDIATEYVERGHPVMKYIQDRTVIEDTESSIDMVDRGWTLYNHPQRLAFSATPPDFGSLLIQRRRWANGGLIILPKTLRYLARRPLCFAKLAETFLRAHYLGSVAAVNTALLLIMFGPFERNLHIVWVPLCMVPYMVVYARDLIHCGYRLLDFPRVYALNLLLLPINLGGTLRSLHQAVTGKRAPFGRTPKVSGRTAAHGGYVLAEYVLLAAALVMGAIHIYAQNWLSASFAGVYVAFVGYGILRFIGLRESAEDLRIWMRPLSDMPRAVELEVKELADASEVPVVADATRLTR